MYTELGQDTSDRTESVELLPTAQPKPPDSVSKTAYDGANNDSSSPNAAPPKRAVLRGILHGLGLKILSQGRRKQKSEAPKVPLWKSRRTAISRLIVHFLPMSICIVLLFLYFRGFYVGDRLDGVLGEEGVEENTLQFASKIHELTMLASLGVVVLTETRRRLLKTASPFGLLFAGIGFANVNYLWSKELWGIVKPTGKSWSGRIFLLVLILATLLAPFIGPASALLMIPKLSDWEAGGTDFWVNATREQLWPSQVDISQVEPSCLADPNGMSCPHSGWEALKTSVVGRFYEEFQVPGKRGFSSMIIKSWSRSTVQQASIADALIENALKWDEVSKMGSVVGGKHYRWRNSSRWEMNDVQQPYTSINCLKTSVTDDGAKISRIPFHKTDLINSSIIDEVRSRLDELEPSLLWVDTSSLTKEVNRSVAAIAVLPRLSPGAPSHIIGCLPQSRWINSTYHITNDRRFGPQIYPVASDIPYDDDAALSQYPVIKISRSWAEYLDPEINGGNITVFQRLFRDANITSESSEQDQSTMIHDVLSLMVTNGLSKAAYTASTQGTLKPDYPAHFKPQNGAVFGKGGQAYNMDGIDTSNMTMFTMNTIISGKGYGHRSKTFNFAATWLILYSVLAIGHIVFTVYTGESYMSFESPAELTTLAIQSEKTTVLENAGAGIGSRHIYAAPVAIREFDGKLGLAFEDNAKGGNPVRPNTSYG
ncbi:hypothetical protein AJ79_07226 [Helicocarpus griseus UAMH5409]|uniref:Uncharacterized protein n=1 Tax=Helicocarpus griseus UAMH5409 TaxID=1447875 RepID=A0A2B7X5D1_9EURO|nr:hypothetical protein AJ79_07226 [Helicocarpus griseus UAMH5409]